MQIEPAKVRACSDVACEEGTWRRGATSGWMTRMARGPFLFAIDIIWLRSRRSKSGPRLKMAKILLNKRLLEKSATFLML